MKHPEAPVHDLIGSIYEAALQADGKLWTGVIDALKKHLQASSALLNFFDKTAWRTRFYTHVGLDEQELLSYRVHFAAKDPHRLAKQSLPPDQVTASNLLVSDGEFRKTEYFADFVSKHKRTYYQMSAYMTRGETHSSNLAFHRTRDMGGFTPKELESYSRYFPHVRRAMEVFMRLRGAELRHQADLTVLDRLTAGVVLLNPAGEVAHLNRAAEHMLAADDGLSVHKRSLTAATGEQSARLQRAIGRACQTGTGQGEQAGGSLLVERPSGRRPWMLSIAPLPRQTSQWIGHESAAGLVFISDPEAQPRRGHALVAKLHELTPAEQRLLEGLLDGLTTKEIAERHGVSFHTVRTQMKSLFGKTGVNRYGDLVRMAAQGEVFGGGDND